jgi:hypothetical protein
VAGAVEDDVLVDLVADDVERNAADQRDQRGDVVGGHDRSRGIVRRVDHQQPRAGRDGGRDGVPVDAVIGQLQRDDDRNAAVQLDRRHVRVVAGFEDDRFVARVHHRGDRVEDRFGAAGGDGDLGVGVIDRAVRVRVLGGDRLAERHRARHRRILVESRAHVTDDRVDQRGIAVEIREPLRQVDGADLGRELRHHREDGGANGGEP